MKVSEKNFCRCVGVGKAENYSTVQKMWNEEKMSLWNKEPCEFLVQSFLLHFLLQILESFPSTWTCF